MTASKMPAFLFIPKTNSKEIRNASTKHLLVPLTLKPIPFGAPSPPRGSPDPCGSPIDCIASVFRVLPSVWLCLDTLWTRAYFLINFPIRSESGESKKKMREVNSSVHINMTPIYLLSALSLFIHCLQFNNGTPRQRQNVNVKWMCAHVFVSYT